MASGGSAEVLVGIHSRVIAALADGDRDRAIATLGLGLGWDVVMFWDLDASGAHLLASSSWAAEGVDAAPLVRDARARQLARGEGKPGQVWATGAPDWQADLSRDPGFLRAGLASAAGFRTGMWLPVTARAEVFGVLEYFRRDAVQLDLSQLEAMRSVSNALALYESGRRASEDVSRMRELLASREKLQRLYESRAIGIAVCTTTGDILEANDAVLDMVGYSRADLEAGRVRWDTLTDPKWREVDVRGLEQLLETGTVSYEKEFVARDGTSVPVHVGAAVLGEGNKTIAYILDIGERKRMERELKALTEELERRVEERTRSLRESERIQAAQAAALAASERQLRALARRLMSSREETGVRISREIHDVLGQELTGLKLDIAWIYRRCTPSADDAVEARLRDVTASLDRMIVTVRRIATELRPQVLDDLGLVAAIRWYAQEFRIRSGLEVETELDDLELGGETATALFRITQELLTNVARHAAATRVTISLHHLDDQVVLRVIDDGNGFDPARAEATASLGLMGIRERSLAVGGSFAIRSSRGGATEASVRVPAPRAREEA